jgi:Polyketide cyclase / dehydrase and lipid transport
VFVAVDGGVRYAMVFLINDTCALEDPSYLSKATMPGALRVFFFRATMDQSWLTRQSLDATSRWRISSNRHKTQNIPLHLHFPLYKDVRKKRDTMKFNLAPNTEELLTKATWRFQSKTEIDLPADTVWSILVDDRAWKEWHPEVTEIVWTDEAPHKTGSERTVVFRDPLTGPIKFYEEFDVWEEGHRFGIHFTALSLPPFASYKSGREEFKVEAGGEKKCVFTRTVAVEPGFVTRYLAGFLIYPHLKKMVEETCPNRLKEAIANGSLPVN